MRVGFIGGGYMGEAMIAALLKQGIAQPQRHHRQRRGRGAPRDARVAVRRQRDGRQRAALRAARTSSCSR